MMEPGGHVLTASSVLFGLMENLGKLEFVKLALKALITVKIASMMVNVSNVWIPI